MENLRSTTRSSSYLPTTTPKDDYNKDSDPEPDESSPLSPDNSSPSKSFSRLLNKRRKQQRKWFLSEPVWNILKKTFFILVAIGNLALSIWVVIEHGNLPELFPEDHLHGVGAKSPLSKDYCHLPHLPPFSPELRTHLSEPSRIDCPSSANSDFKGRIYFRSEGDYLIKIAHPPIPCCWRPFYRVHDEEVWIEPTKSRTYVCHNVTEARTQIPEKVEFIEVICDDKKGLSYKDGFFFIRRKETVEQRIQALKEKEKERAQTAFSKPKTEKLSLIVLGMDSTSRLNFLRRMPRTHEFLDKTLKGIPIEGYLKVGENTLPNLTPLLTGMGLDEFKDRCVMKNPPFTNAIHLDDCPFIWKEFEAAGYRTFFAEDDVSTAIFNLNWPRAFHNPPTDYYLRPFAYRMITAQNVWDGFCYGPRMSVQVLLEYLEKSVTQFPEPTDPMFFFSWASKLTHDDFNRLSWADQYYLRTLRRLHESGKLNNSALLLISDHGFRKESVRQTRQGQLEDRMPLAYIVLPPWFETSYPKAVENLRKNAKDRITSAYDVHETMKDLLDLSILKDAHIQYARQRKLKVAEKKGLRQGTSLFTMLPSNRGCASAGVPPTWCICYRKKKISVKSLDVHDALAYALREMNSQILQYPKCSRLTLSKVTEALKWHLDQEVEDSYRGNMAEESYKKNSLLQITFDAKPDPAHFQVTVLFDPDHGWKFTEQVIRLDQYEDRSWCMHKQELKKLCICQNEEERLRKMEELGGPEFPVF